MGPEVQRGGGKEVGEAGTEKRGKAGREGGRGRGREEITSVFLGGWGTPGAGGLKGQPREEGEGASALVMGSKGPPPDLLGLRREVPRVT